MPAPERPLGYSFHQALQVFRINARRLYRAEHDGELIGIRIGNRVWYSGAQLTALFGAPQVPDPGKENGGGGKGHDVKPAYPSGSEFVERAA